MKHLQLKKYITIVIATVFINSTGFSQTVPYNICLLYTSDAADERSSVDLGGRRIIKKKNRGDVRNRHLNRQEN